MDILEDVDGDGYTDLAFSDFTHSIAWIVSGPISGDVDATDIAQSTWYEPDGIADRITSLRGAGDVDGDGVGDLLLGSFSYLVDRGAVCLIYGPPPAGMHSVADADACFVAEQEDSWIGLSTARITPNA